jgi:hypothetical protein
VESDPKRVKDARQSVFDRGVIAIAASIAEKRVMHPIVDDATTSVSANDTRLIVEATAYRAIPHQAHLIMRY